MMHFSICLLGMRKIFKLQSVRSAKTSQPKVGDAATMLMSEVVVNFPISIFR